MKLINQSVEYLPQEDLFKQIELAARTCYKSEDKITNDSAEKMVDGLIKAGHNAMLEHGTVYLKCFKSEGTNLLDKSNPLSKYAFNKYSKVGVERNEYPLFKGFGIYPTTNYRVLVENNWIDDIQKYLCEPTEWHVKRYTFKIVTSIGIVRELLRHRAFSFANESTRYCNYSKNKFDNEITYIIPHWLKINEETHIDTPRFIDKTYGIKNIIQAGITEPKDIDFISSLLIAEQVYLSMLAGDMRIGRSPQQAREVLPLCTKSELIMTGFEDDWERFLDVRLEGTTGKPHPDMVELAKMIKDKLDKIKDNES